MKNEEVFRTQNLYQAAYCFCHGFKILGTEAKGKKITVVFIGKAIGEKALEFYNGGKVDAKQYSDAYRTLKDMVFQR